ncbi:MAG: hypothetical protein U1F36_05975 [Planctomycetota bacterium]
MKRRVPQILVVAVLVYLSFLVGRGADPLSAQDRTGPGDRKPPAVTSGGPPANQPLMLGDDGGVAASANGILAVTGSYGVGTSVLYVIDTNTKQLAVYEARGGTESMRRITLVGARRIDLDLMIEGYNDESEYSYDALRRRFSESGHAAIPAHAPAGSGETPTRR